MKKIPADLLNEADMAASIPVKKVGAETSNVYDAVCGIRAARQLKKKAGQPWKQLRDILDSAVESGNFSAFDDFAKAWERMDVSAFSLGKHFVGFPSSKPREPVTRNIVSAVRGLQFVNGRAPTRGEILDKLAELGCAIDEAQLSRQLKKMRWQNLIPKAGDLAP